MKTKTSRTRYSLLAVATMLLAQPIVPHAEGSLNTSLVPADSQWVLHLDLERLRQSDLGAQIIAQLPPLELPTALGAVSPNIEKILDTIGRATAFGADFSGDPEKIDGALILEGTPELRAIVGGILTSGNISNPEAIAEYTDLPFESYALEGGVLIGLPEEPIVLVSKSRERMLNALAVYRGLAPSMASNPSKFAKLVPAENEFFFVAVSSIPSHSDFFPANAPQTRIRQMAESASVALGEHEKITRAHLCLNAISPEMAIKLERIVLGMTALISLAESSDHALTEFLNSVTVERRDETVALKLMYPTERILKMLEQILEGSHASPELENDIASAPAESAASDDMGLIISEWIGDKDLPGGSTTSENITTHEVRDVFLESGATITIAGRRGGGERARIDYVEIAPIDGAKPPRRFEAEFTIRTAYQVEAIRFASGGELIMLEQGRGTAQFEFPGESSNYHITVSYVDEVDGKASFAIGVKQPSAE